MRPMSESRRRADVSSRATAPDAWDAGLHAESEAGPIDVGLCVEPSAVGLIVDAPGIGQIKLAFDLQADGTTRLARASRRLSDGRDATLVAIDEAKVLQLEGALARLQKTHEELTGTLVTERDEARDRAAVLSEDRKELAAELESVRQQLSSITADLTTEKEGRLDLLAEREKAREQLADLTTERDDARARLAVLEESARQEAEAREQANATARAELQRVTGELESLRSASGDAGTAQAQLSEDVAEARSRITGLQSELDTLRSGSAEQASQLETLRAGAAEQSQLAAELETARSELDTLRAASAEQTRLAAELARREESLSKAVARGDALQSQLAAAEARMGAESSATKEAREVALKLKAQAAQLQAERDEARTLARQLHAKLGAPKKGESDELRAALDAERQIAANLVSEREQLDLRIEALGRMIDQERDKRARALSERDEWQLRFKALAKGNADVPQPLDFSREETRSYALERATLPETPAARAEAPTDPNIKKKGT